MAVAPFDTIEYILDTARTRLNDAIQAIGGDVLTDNAPFTTVMTNSAWRRFQRKLASFGYTVLEDEFILPSLPPVYALSGTPDPGTQVYLDWAGYWNGQSLNTAFVLPQNMIGPLDCWERISGTAGSYLEMDQILKGLPAVPQQNWNQLWEWRNDALYMPGALTNTDFRCRFQSYFGDFEEISVNPSQVVPIVQCNDPFSWYICSEMANSRGDLDAKFFDTMADAATAMIADRDMAGPRKVQKVSELAKMRDSLTPGPLGVPPPQVQP